MINIPLIIYGVLAFINSVILMDKLDKEGYNNIVSFLTAIVSFGLSFGLVYWVSVW